MMKALFTAATGMDAQQTRIAVISNNIANMNTTGFKSSRAEFEDLIYENRKTAGTESATGITKPTGLQIGSGVDVVSTSNLFTQGTMEQTARSLDLAISGKGFFKVQMPSGEAYTRAGSFAQDQSGKIVTQNGFEVLPSLSIPAGTQNITVAIDGTITGTSETGATVQIGTLNLFSFPNEGGLTAIGKNLFQENEASGSPSEAQPGTGGLGTLQQGFLESSNVNIAEELIRMILAQRGYELNSKVITTSDQMLAATSQIK